MNEGETAKCLYVAVGFILQGMFAISNALFVKNGLLT